MPTYRSAPDHDASTVSAPPTDGSIATEDAWLEVQIEDRDGVDQFSYYLVAREGIPSYASPARVSPTPY